MDQSADLRMFGSYTIKLDRMDGMNFTRWKEKMKFLLTALKVYYVLDGPPSGVITEEEERKREQDETLCRGYILKKYTAKKEGADKSITFKFFEFAMENNMSILDQVHEFLILVSKFKNLNIEIPEKLLVGAIITKLPSFWHNYRKKLMHTTKDFTLDQIQKHLRIKEETRVREKNLNGASSSKNNKKDKKPLSEVMCYKCGENGHIIRYCKNPKKKNQNSNKKDESANAVEQVDTTEITAMVSEMNIGMIQELHMASVTTTDDWWYDSGATTHVCNNRDLFKTYKETKDGHEVMMGDNHTSKVIGSGNVEIQFTSGKKLTLMNVLHVHNIRKNLVSGFKLCKNGVKAVIESENVILSKANVFVGKAYACDGMFKLNINKITSSAYLPDCNFISSFNIECSTFNLWHNRLGHINYRTMKDMLKQGIISYNGEHKDKCEICVQAKMKRKPFPKVDRQSEILELVHSDICELNGQLTRGGNRYFITFIDDCSRYTYVYLLKSKDQAFETFKIYKAEVENQRGKKIQILRSDRGGEYFSTEFSSYCESHGLIHQRTAPYTPQQNGVAERKNRVLQDMINAMLVSANLPKNLWGEALLTACHVPLPNTSKLGPRGLKSVFVGYAKDSKSYRCLDLDSNVIVESRDVDFFENKFRHDSTSTNEIVTQIPQDISGLNLNSNNKRNMAESSSAPRRSERARKERNLDPDFIDSQAIIFLVERLVIQGFSQRQGVDYFDTYAPVARITSIRVLFALASIYNLPIHQMDVKTAFLNGDLDEEVYMKQPEGFVLPGHENKVCKLKKSLYGLKQAPKQWHDKFDKSVLSNGFTHNSSDRCIYSKFTKDYGVILCLYVDDILIVGTNIEDKIIDKFQHLNIEEANTPYESSCKLVENNGRVVAQIEYASAIGCLMYATHCTRPDIAYAVCKLSRYTSNPSQDHWKAIGRIFGYLKRTRQLALYYDHFPAVLEGYSDSSWITGSSDSKSTTGWIFTLGGGAVCWGSKKQTCITHSTMEAEFLALAAAEIEGLHLCGYKEWCHFYKGELLLEISMKLGLAHGHKSATIDHHFKDGELFGNIQVSDYYGLVPVGWGKLLNPGPGRVSLWNRDWRHSVEMKNNGRLKIGNPTSRHSVPFSSSMRIIILFYATTKQNDEFFEVCNHQSYLNFSPFLDNDSEISCEYLVAGDDLVKSFYKASLFESFDSSSFEDGDVPLTRSLLAVPITGSLVIEAHLIDLDSGDVILDDNAYLKRIAKVASIRRLCVTVALW
ncbi:zinc finger, CCHC-type containing protein [Tanacetum coccineum]